MRQVLLFVLAASSTAIAAPPPPVGWALRHDGNPVIYAPADHRDIELRVHAAVPSRETVETWFQRRRATPPAGIASVSLQDGGTAGAIHVAYGRGAAGRRAVMLVVLACPRADASIVYGELIAPDDEAVVRANVPAAVTAVFGACHDRAATTPATPPPAPTAMPPTTTAPSGGTLPAIHAVVSSWETGWSGTTYTKTDTEYLMLADGTVRTSLPDADFDVVADRAAHPKWWGAWKKQGNDYILRFGKYTSTVTNWLARAPGKQGEQLRGTYTRSSSSQTGNVGQWAQRGVSFGPGGRFERSHAGGGHAGATTTTHDDRGTSVTTPAASTRIASAPGDLAGTYRITGAYAIELRYDSGRVERRFFYTDDDRAVIYLAGEGELHDLSKRRRR